MKRTKTLRAERVSWFSLDGDLIGVVSSPLSIDPMKGFIFRMHLTPEGMPVILTEQEDYRSGDPLRSALQIRRRHGCDQG